MRISEMNWMMVEEYLKSDDRAILPLGSTEQHAYLSLSVDSILAERLAVEAAEPLGVPVFPVLAYGITPYFRSFPGTITLRVETYLSILRDILDVMAEQGFVGLAIFLGLLFSCIFSARRLRKQVAGNESLRWVASYSSIVELSIIGYMVSGAFLGRAYFDLFWQIVAVLITLKILYKKEVRAIQTQVPVLTPAWKADEVSTW